MLVRGIKAVGLEHRPLLKNHRTCFQLSAMCCKTVYRPQKGQAPARLWIRYTTQKAFNFQTCFQGSKNQKDSSQGLRQTDKNMSELNKERFLWKVDLWQYFPRGRIISKPERRNVESEFDKQKPVNKPEQEMKFNFLKVKELSHWSRNHPKTNENLVPDHLVSILLLP